MDETWGAPPADVVQPWRCVPVTETDAGACPVGTPDCCCERVLQDLDLVAGSAGGVPVCSIGGLQGGGALYDDPAAELHEDASARLREHPALLGCPVLRRSSPGVRCERLPESRWRPRGGRCGQSQRATGCSGRCTAGQLPNRAPRCGGCSPSFCALLPGVQGQAAPGFGDNSRTRYGRVARTVGPPGSRALSVDISSPSGPRRRCGAVCRAGLLAVAGIHPAGDRGPSRLAGAAGAVHREDVPLTGNVFEALLAMGSQVDG